MLDMTATLPNKLRWPLLAPGDRVLVAVSGGPDSLCLLHILWAGREARGLTSVEAAHLDHGLRGEESAAEAAWVSAWCKERAIPCRVGLADVAALALERKISKQEAARAARYAFLAAVAAQTGADKIATAHTQDDQIETVLMNILRGAGMDGLRGIPAQRGRYVRPLLDVSRAEVEDYCAAHGLEPRRDPSNLSPDAYTRNRVRLELLPLLARDYNPQIGSALLRLSGIATGEWDYLHAQTVAALETTVASRQPGTLSLSRGVLSQMHPALLRRVLRAAVAEVRGSTLGIAHKPIERLCRVLEDLQAPGAVTLQGIFPRPPCDVTVSPGVLTLMLPKTNAPGSANRGLTVGETVHLPEIGWQVESAFEPKTGNPAAQMDRDSIDLPSIHVRNYRQGDSVDPLGMEGRHKKVSDIFTDAKVPRAERHRVPIVADARGIVWVVGHCLADRVKVTPDTQRRLYLTAHRANDAGNPAGGSE